MNLAIAAFEGKATDHSACSGCGLCLLVCPIWRRTGDIELSPLGCCKALQHGAAADDLAAMADWCRLCGACAPVCPERIDLIGLMRSLRHALRLESMEGDSAALTTPLIAQATIRQRLGQGDLLVVEARSYHADYQRRVKLYATLSRETGCMLSLDLQRIAIPARLPAPDGYAGDGDDLTQAHWIVQGREIARIVVEDAADRRAFESLGSWPVITLDELAGGIH